ncbi:hypothetical protein M0R45_008381 [Rubus argutus]|uniref:Uncharacterized protein n=1 Tax=Rubus argutus TaxID=59490 RepID=A0AAW1Y2J9_RUBAR
MLDLLEACLKTSGLEYRGLDGTMSVVGRDKAVKDFNTLLVFWSLNLFLVGVSYDYVFKAASLGLNMVADLQPAMYSFEPVVESYD